MLRLVSRIGLAVGDRRFDSSESTTRQDMIDEIAKLDPSFDASGRSDDYVRARLDAAREDQPSTADAAAAAMKQRAENAWKAPEQRQDAAKASTTKIDPDESARRARKRNEDAWKGKSGVELHKMLTGDDADENGIGAFGMRHS